MALAPGTRLGPYDILSLLGAGGMGEVYRARDTRLERTVAIKILSETLSADPHFRDRFNREARAISQLDHPHICALHDVGEQDGTAFLVMQYLEGETLAERLQKGALPLELALRTAIEIADALDKAHRAGIVHRDLKPGNIMLTKAGAKLLDFGLAKASKPVVTGAGLSMLPTTPPSLTAHGTILGTFQYMAPEQLEGHDADARTDVFSYGAVVYEMVTGRKAFEGQSQASLIAAILNAHPPSLATLRPVTPPMLDHVVSRCLAKHPDERWQSIGDVARELRWITESGAGVSSVVAAPASRRMRHAILITAAASVMTGGLMGAAAVRSRLHARATLAPAPVTRAIVSLPVGVSLRFETNALALSPDGSRLAYVAGQGDSSRIYLQTLDQFEAKPIPGTEGASAPFFSPDGRWLAFASGGQLKKIAVGGGAPQTVCDSEAGYGATWGPDETIVFASSWRAGLSTCSASGGDAPHVLTTPDTSKHEKSHRWPQFLPGGKAVLFNIISADKTAFDDARIAVLSLDTGKIRILLEGGTNPRFIPTGHVLYTRGTSLVAVPFDPRRLEITGPSIPVLDDLSTAVDEGVAHLTVAENGSLAYLRGPARGSDLRVVWVDRQGRSEPFMELRRAFGNVRLAPDGQRLAVTIGSANEQVWVYDLARRTLTPLTFAWDNHLEAWTPDGKRIVFSSDRAGEWNFYWQAADGSGPVEHLTQSPNAQAAGSWSPDGKLFAFNENASGSQNLWLLSLGPLAPTVRRLTQNSFVESEPTFSPDGRWLAYVSNESGRSEVFVKPFPGLDAKWQLSTDGGVRPVWDPHGRELFYQNGRSMMAVAVQTRPAFVAGPPHALFQGPYLSTGLWHDYDVAPDGRFIMIQTGELEAPRLQVALVQNWFEELKRRVGTK